MTLITGQKSAKAVLLFNGECAVCRLIARWVEKSAMREAGGPSIIIRPIGDDPQVLRTLNPDLDIWDAYANIHILMPDGSMRINGEAVAETLRSLPNTRWLARIFKVSVFGLRPFQSLLNFAYTILSDIRPLLGCESCGIPPPWLKPFHWIVQRVIKLFKVGNSGTLALHHTPRTGK
jgi:predicted DCC family thiol-disulfide oxidoreductase YuxK